MKTSSRKLVVALLALAPAMCSVEAAGIPEPALVLYGSVTNTAGPLMLTSAPGGGLIIKWSSVPGKAYSIHRATNLAQGFTPLATNLSATAPQNQFTDPTATVSGSYFYRIQVNP